MIESVADGADWIPSTFVAARDDCIQHGGTRCSALHIPNFERFHKITKLILKTENI